MRIPGVRPPGHIPAAIQLAVMAVVGAACGVLAGVLVSPALGPLVGWDGAALTWLALLWVRVWGLDPDRTARLAKVEDPNRPMRDALLLAACLASLLAVGAVLTATRTVRPGLPRDAYAGLAVLSIVISWFVVHSLYALRYARIYYSGKPGGVDFHQTQPPRYGDFAYLAFTVGATFQVSDTDLSSAEMRRTVLGHVLLAYLFGAVIIAATVNLVASLAK